MSAKKAVFFDVGGVLLTNGWDHESRKAATEKFNLNWEEFESLHDKYAEALDIGIASVNMYLDKVVFDQPRDFSKQDFYEFMKSCSVADEGAIEIAAAIAAQKKYLMATLNNESTDLNLYRIEKFGLGKIFSMFLSSCYLGVRKPEPAIYIRALLIANRRPEETIFIDDREANLDVPKELGFTVIQYLNPQQLVEELLEVGVEISLLQNSANHI
jgi:putative hydrolase of the HAD superfamily